MPRGWYFIIRLLIIFRFTPGSLRWLIPAIINWIRERLVVRHCGGNHRWWQPFWENPHWSVARGKTLINNCPHRQSYRHHNHHSSLATIVMALFIIGQHKFWDEQGEIRWVGWLWWVITVRGTKKRKTVRNSDLKAVWTRHIWPFMAIWP